MLRVALLEARKYESEFDPLREVVKDLSGIRIETIRSPFKDKGFDLLIATQLELTPQILDSTEVPVILVERADSANIWCSKIAQHPRVLRVWKESLIDPSLANTTRGRYHSWLMGNEKEPYSSPLSPTLLDKYRVMPGYWARPWKNHWRRYQEIKRDIDLHFRGTTDYGDPWVQNHRRSLLGVLKRLSKRWVVVCGGHKDYATYRNELLRSRIVVSPYGYGEVAIRDYEAIYAGAHLVKPPVEHFSTWGGTLRESVKRTHWDWSDLEEVVESILDGEQQGERLRSLRDQLWASAQTESLVRFYQQEITSVLDHGT